MFDGRKIFIKIGLAILLFHLTMPAYSAEPFVILVNKDSPLTSITREQAFDLYLGRIQHVNGIKVHLTDLDDSNPFRSVFYKSLGKMSLSQVNAYWARLQFTGKVFPPLTLPNEKSVMERIATSNNSIGYVSLQEIPEQYKVLCCDR